MNLAMYRSIVTIMAYDPLYYLESLEESFENMFMRIHFRPNPKYPAPADGEVFYIGYDDMHDYHYNIRVGVFNEYKDGEDPIVATYSSMKELLLDGWQPD